MRSLLLLVFVVYFANAKAQANKSSAEDTVVYIVADTMPAYPGGKKALMEYINKNIIFSEPKEQCTCTKIILEFVVDKKGYVIKPKVTVRALEECPTRDVFLRNMEKMLMQMPQWSPGSIEGKAVNVKFTLPVNIHLQ